MGLPSILIVDDDPSTCEMIAKILRPAGYSVSCAGGAREALQSLGRQPFDLVLTDIIMPEGDGFELIAALRDNHHAARVIVMSGGGRLDAETYLSMARGFQVDGLLRKPFTSEQLLDAIKPGGERSAVPSV